MGADRGVQNHERQNRESSQMFFSMYRVKETYIYTHTHTYTHMYMCVCVFKWRMRKYTSLIYGVTYFTGVTKISKSLHADGILRFLLGLPSD